MNDEAASLADAALNRGLKLVRSRVRSPGKRGYGKYALKNGAGETVLGGGRPPTATAAEVETYLRTLERNEWSGSLGLTEIPKRRRKREREPAPPPEKTLPCVREARPADSDAVAALIRLLDHPVSASGVRKRLRIVSAPTLVATLGSDIIGLCGLGVATHIHRDSPVGRITILVVAKAHRGAGVGRMLVEDAERRLRAAGCGLVEVSSNHRHAAAHNFYAHLGYQQTSLRFAKELKR